MPQPSHADIAARVLSSMHAAYANRPWLVATDIVQSSLRIAEELQELGASKVFALGASMGTGDVPEGTEWACLNVRKGGIMQGIRAAESAMATLPPDLQARIDAWDPHRQAKVVRALFSSGAAVGHRACWGGRPAAWMALEDKTVIDALWDACDVPRQPALVVDARPDTLLAAHRQRDRGLGTVWAADNRQGWHGGANGTRWVRDLSRAHIEAVRFQELAWKVRVMPFVEGIPCSIHGIVFPDHVVALRPCEMVVFRQPSTGTFQYGRAASFWDPSPDDRKQMRDMTRRVGAYLRQTVGYRGTFTIDGVMGAEGFVPTELNPRFGAAISMLARSLPKIQLYLLHLAIVAGAPLDFTPTELEDLVLDAADTHRQGSCMLMLQERIEHARAESFDHTDVGWQPAADVHGAHVRVQLDPSAVGGMLFVRIDPSQFPVGEPIAPKMARLFEMLDARWSLGIGELEAARQLR